MQYDIFNGDADGICALHQLRLALPKPDAQLVTGVKRDIKLLGRLVGKIAADDALTVLDISMDSNRQALDEILSTGADVCYVDHHFAGEQPDVSNLTSHIDPSADICTSLIVDRILDGKYRAWAVTAAFGDNLHDAARKAAEPLALSDEELATLRELGELLNYNGYGASPSDLHFTPQELYRALQPFADPLQFFRESEELAKLRNGFKTDMANANKQKPLIDKPAGRIFRFPAESWSKRVAGVFSNEKARQKPDQAHALLVDNGDGTLMASVRAPLARKHGADKLCLAFPTGGGRTAAAGINAMPEDMLEQFLSSFEEVFAP